MKAWASLADAFSMAIGRSRPLELPPAPLYDFGLPASSAGIGEAEARKALLGHYAHYDVVAYEDRGTKTPMKSFVVSYGFTDFVERDGKILQIDRFVHASHKINQRGVRTSFADEATAAIEPRVQEVRLYEEGGAWRVYRPESPVLLGIGGDPSKPLSRDPLDPLILDSDGDGRPGVTVHITIAGILKGELYITRREIYRDYLALYPDGRWIGHIEDLSEQFVIGASMRILRQESNNRQVPDPALNPIMLARVPESVSTWKELEPLRDELFPPEPAFVEAAAKPAPL
ncbi:MAG TPA: hypothetical protein DCG47_02150 [Spirochaetaceae bacterium]|nr:hypothetical protein [Spirochaetaceae bacterium]